MYIEIKIVNPTDIKARAYIEYYYEEKRFREYNGKRLKLDVNPNRSKSFKQREASLKKLHFEYLKAFENGWYPSKVEFLNSTPILTFKDALKSSLDAKLTNKLSRSYITDLKSVYDKFIDFVPQHLLDQPLEVFNQIDYDSFLSRYKSSATYYMNKRRTLGVLFAELVRKRLISYNPLRETTKQKTSATLHEIYSKSELIGVLEFLKKGYPNLHLCCLLAYGCFLRPHQEARLLTLNNFNLDLTQIKLSGIENKSKRIRVVNIPIYVQEVLLNILKEKENRELNIFSKSFAPFNESYFNTQWSRAKNKMLKIGLIKKNQTIYSFRHTAAVNVYRKTKDLNILQQLLGHSDMIVTLKYLRGLGEATNEELRNVMPEL